MAARNNVRNFMIELPLNPATRFTWSVSYRCSVSRLFISRTTYFRSCSQLDSSTPVIRYPPERPLPPPAAETHPLSRAPDTPPIPSSRGTPTSATDTPQPHLQPSPAQAALADADKHYPTPITPHLHSPDKPQSRRPRPLRPVPLPVPRPIRTTSPTSPLANSPFLLC
jgi:hypothetical protein